MKLTNTVPPHQIWELIVWPYQPEKKKTFKSSAGCYSQSCMGLFLGRWPSDHSDTLNCAPNPHSYMSVLHSLVCSLGHRGVSRVNGEDPEFRRWP